MLVAVGILVSCGLSLYYWWLRFAHEEKMALLAFGHEKDMEQLRQTHQLKVIREFRGRAFFQVTEGSTTLIVDGSKDCTKRLPTAHR
jgi:hypothetical protein